MCGVAIINAHNMTIYRLQNCLFHQYSMYINLMQSAASRKTGNIRQARKYGMIAAYLNFAAIAIASATT